MRYNGLGGFYYAAVSIDRPSGDVSAAEEGGLQDSEGFTGSGYVLYEKILYLLEKCYLIVFQL